ncbi:MAG: hypothetical protein IT302_02110 [Dehalococcoidia bacterium]|nr:hypothetical protein [Dehalococcoidia bacterium]
MTRVLGIWNGFWARSWWLKGPVLAVVGFIALAILGAAMGDPADKQSVQAEAASPAAEASPASRAATSTSTRTPLPPTSTPVPPTNTPVPPTPTPTPSPVVLSGSGQGVASAELGAGVWVADITHAGRRNFILKLFPPSGSYDLLVNVIGRYEGRRPVWATPGGKFTFDADADGAWAITLSPIGAQPEAFTAFSGKGDGVSGMFKPTVSGARTYAFTHDGTRNFIVSLECDKGRTLAQNVIGPLNVSRVVNIDRAATLCLWEVQADGAWSIRAQ